MKKFNHHYFILLLSFLSIYSAQAQVTVTLGSGTYDLGVSPNGPSPYNNEYPGRIMQFVYTASELKAAGGGEGEIVSLAWKVKDVAKEDMNDYGIWMKNTSASDASKHDVSNLKQVMNRFTYKTGSAGWQTLKLDTAFYWDGTSNILIHVCFGALPNVTAAGSVYAYNSASNQRRGEISKGTACGMSTTATYSYKPFVQFEMNLFCSTPKTIQFSGIKSSGATMTWPQAASGGMGYEYTCSATPGTPASPGTYTKDTTATVKGLCPGKVYYCYVRTVCDKGDTSEWSKAYAFSTPNAGKIGTNAPICVGDTLKMWVENARDYSWSGPSGFSSTSQAPIIYSAQRNQGGNYFVTITDSNYCNVVYTAGLKVDTIPVAVINQNSPLCAGEDIKASASGGSVYNWTGPNGYTSNTENVSVISATTADSGTYKLWIENSFGCKSTAQTVITVNETPKFAVTTNSPVCAGDTLKFAASGNYTFEWTGPNGFKSSMANPITLNAPSSLTGGYDIVASTKANCKKTEQFKVIVNALPSVAMSGKTDICEGSTLSFTASGAITYEWYNGTTKLDTGKSFNKANMANTDAGTYRLVGLDGNNCLNWEEKVVSVLTLPTVSATAPDSICAGKTLTLTGQTNGAKYGWSGPGSFKNTTLTATIADVKTSQSGNYIFTTTGSNGCMAETSKRVSVLTLPSISISRQGNNMLATAGYNTYTWYKDGVEDKSTTSRLLTATATGKYTVKVVGGNGCEATSDEVDLTSLSVPSISNSTVSIYPNPASTQITIVSNQTFEKVVMTNQLGMEVYSSDLKDAHQTIDIRDLATGMYIILVTDSKGDSYRNTFIKQ